MSKVELCSTHKVHAQDCVMMLLCTLGDGNLNFNTFPIKMVANKTNVHTLHITVDKLLVQVSIYA